MKDHTTAPIEQLIPLHVKAEALVAEKIAPLSAHYCSRCETPCCHTDYCAETGNSDFLQQVLRYQSGVIATDHHWLSATGCTLKSGKPMVCQEYFCDTIRNEQPAAVAEIAALLKEWKAIYQNYHRGRSLLSSPADTFSKPKLAGLISKLENFIGQHQDAE